MLTRQPLPLERQSRYVQRDRFGPSVGRRLHEYLWKFHAASPHGFAHYAHASTVEVMSGYTMYSYYLQFSYCSVRTYPQ